MYPAEHYAAKPNHAFNVYVTSLAQLALELVEIERDTISKYSPVNEQLGQTHPALRAPSGGGDGDFDQALLERPISCQIL